MPTYEITDPESGRTVRVTGDTPPTEQELTQIFSQPSVNSSSGPLSLINSLGQGLSFGWGDEAASALKATVVSPFSDQTWGEVYRDQLETERANLAATRSAHPILSTVTEIGGAAATGTGVGQQVAKTGGNFLSRIPKLAQLFGMGAAGGAIYGAGSSEEGERTEGAAIGGALGGATVPVGVAAGHVGKSLWTKLVQPAARVALNSPRTQAVRNVLQALEADDIMPDEAFRRLQELGPDAVLADLGENMSATARGAAGKLGRAKTIASSFLTGRQQGQSSRLFNSIFESQGADAVDIGDFRRGFLNFMTSRQSAAAPLYEEAMQSPLQMTDTLKAILNRPAMRDALRQATTFMQNEGGGVSHMRLIQYAKEALDDRIGSAIQSGNRNEARILTRLKNQLLEEVDAQVPSYQQARAMFAGEAQLRDAADMGRGLFTSTGSMRSAADVDSIELALENMAKSEKDAFRIGVVRGLIDAVETSPNTRNVAQQLIRSPRSRQVLRLAFDSEESFERFLNTAQAESTFSQTTNKVLSGSRTAEFMQDIQNVDRGASALRAATQGGSDPISSGIQMLKQLGFGDASDETLEEMAKLLFSRGEGLAVIQRQAQRAASTPTPQIVRDARMGASTIGLEQSAMEGQ